MMTAHEHLVQQVATWELLVLQLRVNHHMYYFIKMQDIMANQLPLFTDKGVGQIIYSNIAVCKKKNVYIICIQA